MEFFIRCEWNHGKTVFLCPSRIYQLFLQTVDCDTKGVWLLKDMYETNIFFS